MPNPNFSEFILHAVYGQDDDAFQATEIYNAVAEDAYEIEQKYVEGVDDGGMWVDLTFFFTYVRQVVVQNTSTTTTGVVFWVDNATGSLIPVQLVAGEHISINNPNVAVGIMLFALNAEEITRWHLAIAGGIP